MSSKMKVTPNDLGFKRPENHSEESKKQILQMIEAETNAPRKVRFSSPWVTLSGIAASLLFVFFLTQTNDPLVSEILVEEEDVFVTSLLMDTLLLEEEELDQAIQDALLDNFENDLALK
ncbi:MAG: hypothetical protein ABF256_06025 [Candidatus Arcticimaribacter sp.]